MKTSGMGGSRDRDLRPDTTPPVSGRTSRRLSPNVVYVGDLLWSLPAGLEMGTWRPPVHLWRVAAVHPILRVTQA